VIACVELSTAALEHTQPDARSLEIREYSHNATSGVGRLADMSAELTVSLESPV
jgi:hypothetical protein